MPLEMLQLAYIGAGADLGLISAAIGLILTLGSSVFFMVLWPLRMFLRKFKRGPSSQSADSEPTSLSIDQAASPPHDRAAPTQARKAA